MKFQQNDSHNFFKRNQIYTNFWQLPLVLISQLLFLWNLDWTSFNILLFTVMTVISSLVWLLSKKSKMSCKTRQVEWRSISAPASKISYVEFKMLYVLRNVRAFGLFCSYQLGNSAFFHFIFQRQHSAIRLRLVISAKRKSCDKI